MRILVLLASLNLIASCSSNGPTNPALQDDIGWLYGNCLAIKNTSLSSETPITLVYLNGDQSVAKASVSTRAVSSAECPALKDDRRNINEASGYIFYLVESERPVDYAIGISGPGSLTGLSFSYCNTREAVRYTVKKNNSVIWQGYYYLGYDQDPTCNAG